MPRLSEAPWRRRRLAPWLALALLVLLDAIAGHAAAPAEAPGGEDVKDTHRRLGEIYKRLGIEREPAERARRRGCNGSEDDDVVFGRSSASAGPRARPLMPPMLGYLLVAAVIMVMLIPLYLSLRASYRRAAATPGAEPEADEPVAPSTSERAPWRVDLQTCRRLLEAGRLPEAFAALHRALLLGLEQQRHLVLDRTTTNWEYVRRLASHPQLRQVLAAVTQAAEASVLGERPLGREQYLSLEERVIAMTREGAA